MQDIRNIIKRLGLYYLLSAAVALFTSGIIPDVFPIKLVSSVLFLSLTVLLFFYYYYHVPQCGLVRSFLLAIAGMIILLILLRGIKYTVFWCTELPKRYTWYLYYIPILSIPLLMFLISVQIGTGSPWRLSDRYIWVIILTVIFILLVLTNDFHQLVFGFNPHFESWDSDYSHGIGFVMLTIWEYLLYFSAVAILFKKCRTGSGRKYAWIILVPFILGLITQILLLTGRMIAINGENIIQFPETIAIMAVGVIECCMQLGMIPINNDYSALMKISSIAAQITDTDGNIIFKSDNSDELTAEEIKQPDKTFISEDIRLRRMDIPGGYGLWQEDLKEINAVNRNLAELQTRLSMETELMQLKNTLKEKTSKLEQKNELYADIIDKTAARSQEVADIAQRALSSDDGDYRERCRKRILIFAVYIKRYANLKLLAEDSGSINSAELGLSIAESLKFINYYGIPGEILCTAKRGVSAQLILDTYELYQKILESGLDKLAGIYVNISEKEGRILFKMAVEYISADSAGNMLKGLRAAIADTAELNAASQSEDNAIYISVVLPMKGGA